MHCHVQVHIHVLSFTGTHTLTCMMRLGIHTYINVYMHTCTCMCSLDHFTVSSYLHEQGYSGEYATDKISCIHRFSHFCTSVNHKPPSSSKLRKKRNHYMHIRMQTQVVPELTFRLHQHVCLPTSSCAQTTQANVGEGLATLSLLAPFLA